MYKTGSNLCSFYSFLDCSRTFKICCECQKRIETKVPIRKKIVFHSKFHILISLSISRGSNPWIFQSWRHISIINHDEWWWHNIISLSIFFIKKVSLTFMCHWRFFSKIFQHIFVLCSLSNHLFCIRPYLYSSWILLWYYFFSVSYTHLTLPTIYSV